MINNYLKVIALNNLKNQLNNFVSDYINSNCYTCEAFIDYEGIHKFYNVEIFNLKNQRDVIIKINYKHDFKITYTLWKFNDHGKITKKYIQKKELLKKSILECIK